MKGFLSTCQTANLSHRMSLFDNHRDVCHGIIDRDRDDRRLHWNGLVP